MRTFIIRLFILLGLLFPALPALAAAATPMVAAGHYHTVALKADGTLLAWGFNYYGQLGDCTTTNCYSPVSVSGYGCVGVLNLGFGTPAQMIANLI